MVKSSAQKLSEPFKGWVRYEDWFEMREMKLRERRPTDVVIKNMAAQACYTLVLNIAHPDPNIDEPFANRTKAVSPGHGAMGIVVEVGDQVRRVKVGDRVVTPVTPACGTCYSCIRGEWAACGHKSDIDWTDPNNTANPPFATMTDGTPVWQDHTGGFAEYSICPEAWVVPVNDSPLSDVELASLACVPGPGWTFGLVGMPITIGSSVVVIGAGPLGLSLIQTAKMMGARLIIAADRIPARLAAAEKAGAHVVLNVDELGEGIVDKVRELCTPPTENMDAGGKPLEGFYSGRGADHVFEATGRTLGAPTTGRPDDTSGAAAVRWGWQATRRGGTFVHTGWTAPTTDADVWGPAPGPFDYHAKKYLSAAYGGGNVLREIPRLAKLIEMGYLDAESLIDPVMPFEQADVALQHALDRDKLLPIITFEA